MKSSVYFLWPISLLIHRLRIHSHVVRLQLAELGHDLLRLQSGLLLDGVEDGGAEAAAVLGALEDGQRLDLDQQVRPLVRVVVASLK